MIGYGIGMKDLRTFFDQSALNSVLFLSFCKLFFVWKILGQKGSVDRSSAERVP
jgi:hypothetical protein